MLSKKEKLIMYYILEKSGGKSTCLLTPLDLEYALQPKYSANNIEIQAILEGLVQEEYINLVNSDKNGELIYCITILTKGKSFNREQKNIKKSWSTAIVKTILLAVLSFIVGIILKAIFIK
ncbi:MAG TPA: hypothetical protein DD614_04640 [Clostridiales bacterium]|nr:hypothetical protein [Clostridiales bacterium]